MAEDDAIFDPSLMKKKKKKKTPFDLDAMSGAPEELADVDSMVAAPSESKPVAEGEDDLDLENFNKKKKKKKKPFNLDELEGALPSGAGEGDAEAKETKEDGEVVADDGLDEDFKLDFSMKKKRKKKKDLTELMEEQELVDGQEVQDDEKDNDFTCLTENDGTVVESADENATSWAGSDRDYTYDELLNRVFEIILDKNPEMAGGRKPKFVMRPPQVLRVGTKKTSFANFTEICKTLHRLQKHLLDFLLAELGTSGSVDGNNQLIIKGRFQPKQIENVLRRYIKEYVTCHTCRSPDTILQKDTRLFFLQCESCGSRCSVASIKSGFQAVTSKRAAMRAKTA
ncbi:eukaryotic translation initiation factor 2 subunit 2 isoform X1 [Anopheles nili]|uniref:eukaryotic translation initiation factor 2 subunit 2 isoform X1 n=1 Tax=Anopheles nili TaxID=185578 RepID=UPI00237C3FAB|nr:eukaryotic translation initiation factor 2 subunit 2 isoform X1 [Anopheles nili]